MSPRKQRTPPYHHGDLAAALLAAAEEILAERGLDGFTLRECARRAGAAIGIRARESHPNGTEAGPSHGRWR